MLIDELIKILENIKENKGNLPVYSVYDDGFAEFEINSGHIEVEEEYPNEGYPERLRIGN